MDCRIPSIANGYMKMAKKNLEKYSAMVVLLLMMTILFIAVPLIFTLGNFLSGTFVIAGMTCAILGSFVIMFTGKEPVDPRVVGLLPVQGCMNLCRIASDAGIKGNAFFLPSQFTGSSRVMQFNPVSTFNSGMISSKETFTENKPHGLITIPVSDLLIQDLYKRHALEIPNEMNELSVLLSETLSDTLEFAPDITTTWKVDSVTIIMHEYRFIDGCFSMQVKSPLCCTRFPCPACSLCGTLIAACINKVVSLHECRISSEKDITMTFSFD